MSEHAFFTAEARAKASALVKEIEANTAAEIVITVRRSSGYYRHADYLFGFLVSLVSLVAILFVPQEFALYSIPIDVLLSFVLGAWLCSQNNWIRRLLTRRSVLESNARTAALAAFVELGVSKTRARTGVLIFASIFERRVEVVADVGIDTQALAPEMPRIEGVIHASLLHRPSVERFLSSIRALGPVLAKVHPRSEGDINELSDELRAS